MSEELFTNPDRIEYLGLAVVGGLSRWSFRDMDSDVAAVIDLVFPEASPTGKDCLLAFVGSPSDGKMARLDQVKAMFSTLSDDHKEMFFLAASSHPAVFEEPVFEKAFGSEAIIKTRVLAADPWHRGTRP